MNPETLAVSEIFESVQGEGPSVGTPSVFLRLSLCNLRCSFCDTPYTWDFKRFDRAREVREMTIDEVRDVITGFRAGNLVLTGGEPLLQAEGIARLLERLPAMRTEVETAGTLLPGAALDARIDQWNVSPKLASSENPLHRRIRTEVLTHFAASPRATFKFVVCSEADLAEIDALVERFGIDRRRVILMPEGRDAATLAARGRALVPHCIARGYRYGHRLHVVLFGDERGT